MDLIILSNRKQKMVNMKGGERIFSEESQFLMGIIQGSAMSPLFLFLVCQ